METRVPTKASYTVYFIQGLCSHEKKKKKNLGNSTLEGSRKHKKLSALMLKPNSKVDIITNTT